MFFDQNYLLYVLLPTMVISLLAQWYLRSSFRKWHNLRNSAGLNGTAIAERIIRRTEVGDVHFERATTRSAGAAAVRVERGAGAFGDHYDPRSHTVRLSPETAGHDSVAAMAIVAHELGHAWQHEQRSPLIQLRSMLLPAVSLGPQLAFGLIVAGLLLNFIGLTWLGIAFFGLVVVFSVLTLPVEFDASRRGLILLREAGLMQAESDESGSRAVLRAAALTYVAATVTAVLQLLYYISLAQRRN